MSKEKIVDVPVASKTLRLHLEKYKNKVLRLGFSPRRSFVVDSCDFILEEAGTDDGQTKNIE
jgi:hypothetical protein